MREPMNAITGCEELLELLHGLPHEGLVSIKFAKARFASSVQRGIWEKDRGAHGGDIMAILADRGSTTGTDHLLLGEIVAFLEASGDKPLRVETNLHEGKGIAAGPTVRSGWVVSVQLARSTAGPVVVTLQAEEGE